MLNLNVEEEETQKIRTDKSVMESLDNSIGHKLARSVSPVPSLVSMRSDRSKWNPPDFSKEEELPKSYTELPVKTETTESELFKANTASQNLFSDHKDGLKRRCEQVTEGTDGGGVRMALKSMPSCVSMRSDRSKWNPPDFSKEEELPKSYTELPINIQITETALFKDTAPPDLFSYHKHILKRRYEQVTEGTDGGEGRTALKSVYTELYITEGRSEELSAQHEARQLETVAKKKTLDEKRIMCQDIFKNLPDEQKPIRVVLTNGVAGVGKTFSVLKFILDWAEDLENQDIHVVIPLSFRELNLVRNGPYSLLTLLYVFHPALDKLTVETLSRFKILFIFDGLDESRLPLDFLNSEEVSDVTQTSSVSVLLVNLIRGKLLPTALFWITSRPAAANQISASCIDRVTELRGFFTDAQKEEYFRKRFTDERLSTSMTSHIHACKPLYNMCQIPVFCWIAATVFAHMFTTEKSVELPKTLTDLYAHFQLVQMMRKKNKYETGQDKRLWQLTREDSEALLKLGRLAFEQLNKGNLMFYEEDLELCGLDVTEASVYSGICNKIFKKEECVIFDKPVFCFVHLSVQEFLAAVYIFHAYLNRNSEILTNFLCNRYAENDDKSELLLEEEVEDEEFSDEEDEPFLDHFLSTALENSFRSKTGHLDLFVRFLHGLSLESNQRLLGDLFGHTEICPETVATVINDLKEMSGENVSPDRSINIFHCLTEMKDQTVHREVQEFLRSSRAEREALSEIQCSALAYMLQVSEEVLDELDLAQYRTSQMGRWRLVPAVRNCRKAILSKCGLTEKECEIVSSALQSSPSHLRLLHISDNELEAASMQLLSSGLQSPHCKLETLRLITCDLSEAHCASLASALRFNPSHLLELDLGDNNDIKDAGVALLCDFLQSPNCKLHTLRLSECLLSPVGCASLASAFQSNPSRLRTLDLSVNDLQESGLNSIGSFLQMPQCHLEVLRLEMCSSKWVSCASLASALRSNPSHLRELDLSNTRLRDTAVAPLWDFLQSPDCQVAIMRLKNCKLSQESCASLVSALKSSWSHLKELDLRGNSTHALEELCGLFPAVDLQI